MKINITTGERARSWQLSNGRAAQPPVTPSHGIGQRSVAILSL
jgi:hypothetical protein